MSTVPNRKVSGDEHSQKRKGAEMRGERMFSPGNPSAAHSVTYQLSAWILGMICVCLAEIIGIFVSFYISTFNIISI